jgi:hypothetical protein
MYQSRVAPNGKRIHRTLAPRAITFSRLILTKPLIKTHHPAANGQEYAANSNQPTVLRYRNTRKSLIANGENLKNQETVYEFIEKSRFYKIDFFKPKNKPDRSS